MSAQRITVVDGGNRFDLLAQLTDIGRYEDEQGVPFPLKIEVGIPTTRLHLNVSICGVIRASRSNMASSGAGNAWTIFGFVCPTQRSNTMAWIEEVTTEYPVLGWFHGHYNTRGRTGYIELGPWRNAF